MIVRVADPPRLFRDIDALRSAAAAEEVGYIAEAAAAICDDRGTAYRDPTPHLAGWLRTGTPAGAVALAKDDAELARLTGKPSAWMSARLETSLGGKALEPLPLGLFAVSREGDAVSAEDPETVYERWKEDAAEGSPLPLRHSIEAWLDAPTPRAPFDVRRKAVLPSLDRIDPDERVPPTPHGFEPAAERQLTLPTLQHAVTHTPSWLLYLFDRARGDNQGGPAHRSLRLFVGAMLHTAIADRDGEWHTVRLPAGDVIRWLWPDGWAHRYRDWRNFPAALEALKDLAWVPVPGLGRVAVLFPSVIPATPDDPLVEFTVRVPASAAAGARIDWQRLCRYGAESAAVYRAYLGSAALMDCSAHNGQPLTAEIHPPLLGADGRPRRRKGGAVVRDPAALAPNPAARYVPRLTDGDLARIAGLDGRSRMGRKRAREAFERLHADGVVDLRHGRDGWRLFGPPPGGA